ncbi:MAG TPA: hypothetical protein VNK43_00570 [Gemmatimonadales bacterium]|nr:hypothetical protein [Gemmatimonadales bacterium]
MPPDVTFDPHSGVNGFAFSPGGAFGFEGDAFIAMFGADVPAATGINIRPAGYSVGQVNVRTRQVREFASNALPGPSYVNRGGGFDRPTDIAFGPDGSMYVLDWGASTVTDKGLELVPQTGLVWRVFPERLPALRPGGPVVVEAAPLPPERRRAQVRNVPELYAMLAPTLLLLLGGLGLAAIALLLVIRASRRT